MIGGLMIADIKTLAGCGQRFSTTGKFQHVGCWNYRSSPLHGGLDACRYWKPGLAPWQTHLSLLGTTLMTLPPLACQ